jgi:uncharacterized pyridoxamine 5'-phosphate oxidase family protein
MTPEERDQFLAEERTCRFATVDNRGKPHVTPLWFVWDGTAIWLYSLVKSQRWTDVQSHSDIAVVVDSGTDYLTLRGVEIRGPATATGEVPRTQTPDSSLATPERLFALKYLGNGDFYADRRHAWLRVTPQKITSWDFRKLATSDNLSPG